MVDIKKVGAAAGMALALAATSPALANDREVVESFYTQFINPAGAKDKTAMAEQILSPNFESHGDYSGQTKTRDQLAKQLAGFAQLIPDLNWKIEEILQSGNRYIVRSRASGTPKGPMFGVDGQGRSFTIMTIDIHEVVGGKISRVYHVEDWAGAIRQLSGK